MPDRTETIVRGDLVEIALTSDAKKSFGLSYSFELDKSRGINIPGRTCVGYVTEIDGNSVSLAQEWNKQIDNPVFGIGSYETKCYFDAIESWKKR